MSIESTEKLLEYINKVAREPMVVNGQAFGCQRVDDVMVNESFFWKDDCQMCGKCCPNETTAWTLEGLHRIKNTPKAEFDKFGLDYAVIDEIIAQSETHVVSINGRDIEFFVHPNDKNPQRVGWPDRKEQPRCHWLFERDGTYRCRIHPVRSITCGMPHCRMFHNTHTNRTVIGLSQFGRNWRLMCPVEFGQQVDEESVQVRIQWLKRLQEAAEDCKVQTWLPEILETLDSGVRHPFIVPRKKKLF